MQDISVEDYRKRTFYAWNLSGGCSTIVCPFLFLLFYSITAVRRKTRKSSRECMGNMVLAVNVTNARTACCSM